MTIKSFFAGAAFALAGLAASGASAAVIFDNPTPTAEMDTMAAPVLDTFTAPAGPATATFTIDGYASLDGQNAYEDDFTLTLNGAPILVGTFNLGGGGEQVLYTAPVGTVVTNVQGYTAGDVSFTGGQETVKVPVSLEAGENTLGFSYASLSDPNHAGFQGLGDEGWGIRNVRVVGGVPEPGAWALMIVGFGGLGATLRAARRTSRVAT
jgi:hypothetical protein